MFDWLPIDSYRQMPVEPVVYVIRHLASGKEYVGLSVHPRRRLRQHGLARTDLYLHRAIREHGTASFVVRVILAGNRRLADLEIETIAACGSRAPNGYNMTDGGDGGNFIEWTPQRRAAAASRATGRKASEATKVKMSATQKTVVRKAQSAAVISASTARLLALPARGPCSDQTKIRIKAALAGKSRPHHAGQGNPMYGLNRGMAPRARPVGAWAPGSMVPLTFDCVQDAADHFHVVSPQISVWASGKTRPRSGWVFAYL